MALKPLEQRAGYNPAAYGGLTPEQQQLVAAALGTARRTMSAQEQAAMDVYRQGAPPTSGGMPPAPLAPTPDPAPIGGGRPGGGGMSAQQMYQRDGGQAGTGMTLPEYKAWLNKFRANPGSEGYADPMAWAKMMGLGYAGFLTKPREGQKFAGAGANVFSPGQNLGSYYNSNVLSDQGMLSILNRGTGGNYGSLEEATKQLGPGFQMAGAGQYALNQMGEEGRQFVRDNPYLQNVSQVGLYDPSTLNLFLGGYGDLLAKGHQGEAQRITEQRQAMVPEWMMSLQDKLLAQGLPALPIEMLGDPAIMRAQRDDTGRLTGIGLPSPGEPLFGAGDRPTSLFSLTGNQTGESSFYRGLSAEELLGEIGPLMWAYLHREAGAPAPEGFEAGLTFGSPVWNPETGTYTKSPVMGMTGGPQQIGAGVLAAQGLAGETDPAVLGRELGGGLYNRWSAYGYPGEGSSNISGQVSGTRVRRNPETGQLETYEVSEDPFAAMGNSQFPDFWAEPNFAPWETLDPETLKRLLALRANPTIGSAYLG